MSNFRYIICSNGHTELPKGTNDTLKALNYASTADYYVVDLDENIVYLSGSSYKIIEAAE